jgi:hypothetical protein
MTIVKRKRGNETLEGHVLLKLKGEAIGSETNRRRRNRVQMEGYLSKEC